MERLQKYLANCGVASRRTAEEFIQKGRVRVNGEVVTELGTKIEPGLDEVYLDQKKVEPLSSNITVALYKPEGYVCTANDQFNRPNVCQLVKLKGVRLYPIGRLDYQTTGLILLTNDGELANLLTHPKHHVSKEYEAVLSGTVSEKELDLLRKGVRLEDGYKTQPAKVTVLSANEHSTKVLITVYEGKNHLVRRMSAAIGHPTLHLKRVREGSVGLEGLSVGKYRYLTDEEVAALKRGE